MARLRIATCQIDTRVGDLDHNVELILDALARATEAGCDLAVFPELAITGYPPEDLLLRRGFNTENRAALERVAAATGDCVAIVGFVDADRHLYNAAAVCAGGEVIGTYRKQDLPNHSVFDEARYFAPGPAATTLWGIGGVNVGIAICEDAWNPAGPILHQVTGGADLIVVPNASPFAEDKAARREQVMATRAAEAAVPLVYVNQVGGQDELVFDGGSMVLDGDGARIARSPQFVEDLMIVDVPVDRAFHRRPDDVVGRPTAAALPVVRVGGRSGAGGGGAAEPPMPDLLTSSRVAPRLDPDEEAYRALVTGTRAYLVKNGFGDVVIGLSGGIDSTLVAAIAVDAIGADHVHGVLMPSRYSTDHSRSDAVLLAENLGIEHRLIPIEDAHAAMLGMLEESFAGHEIGLTEENIQSRIRGLTLMALSNAFGWIVLSTGNKSETAVGYTTLYGDTVGGYAVLKDLYKTRVYDLCRWRNTVGDAPVIPESVITKPPSAELRPDQRDDDSLPPYEELDPILRLYVEGDLTVAEIIALGHDEAVVRRITGLVDAAEYKRRQSPIGPRITEKAFGKDRRLPITNGYR